MTTRLREYSTTASGNNSSNVGGVNFAEGQLPSTVNNSARQHMANVRGWYDPAEADWVDWSATASVATQTTFKLAGNQTALFVQGRRIRMRGGSAQVTATVLSASYTAETVVTVEDKSGSLSASQTIVGLALAPVAMARRVDKLEVSATLSVGGALNVSGGINIPIGDLSVGGNAVVTGLLNVTNQITSSAGIFSSATMSASVVNAAQYVKSRVYSFSASSENPGGGTTGGDIYYNSSANAWRGWNGSSWVTFTTS